MMKPFAIFRAGTHTAMDGTETVFSDADINDLVRGYDPALAEAPLVLGHPKSDDPAQGWVTKLKIKKGLVYAGVRDIAAEFAEQVAAGRYRKRSVALYSPAHPSNPRPGSYYLKHVGWLGAQQPALKGLPDPAFAEAAAEGLLVFADTEIPSVPGHTIGNRSRGAGNPFIPEHTIEELAMAESEAELTKRQQALANQETALADKKAVLDTRSKAVASREEELKFAELGQFTDKLVAEGRLLPKDRPGITAFLASVGDGTLEFGEGSDAYKGTAPGYIKDFLAGLPKQLDYGEHSAAPDQSGPADPPAAVASYASPDGYEVDKAEMKKHNQALAYQAQHDGVSYADAITRVEYAQ